MMMNRTHLTSYIETRAWQVSVTFGIPTVKREKRNYLEQSLRSIFDNIGEDEYTDLLVVLMVAEPFDQEYVNEVTRNISASYPEQLKSGLLEIIAPPAEFYPDLDNLKQNFNDSAERTKWRSKQNIDYAYLMMHASGM